jgi:hypothetical protein
MAKLLPPIWPEGERTTDDKADGTTDDKADEADGTTDDKADKADEEAEGREGAACDETAPLERIAVQRRENIRIEWIPLFMPGYAFRELSLPPSSDFTPLPQFLE